jgi:hypothetical protein
MAMLRSWTSAFALLLGLLLVGTLTASGPALAQALSDSRDEVLYQIRSGDTLINLGQRYFVSGEAYKAVQRANGISDPDRLRVGTTIAIPTSLLRSTPLEAKVVAFRGNARATRGGRTLTLALGAKLTEGALIETGPDGYLTFQLANGSRIALPSNSRVRIVRMRAYTISKGADLDFMVERGRTETTATPLRDNRSRFRMRTPVAVSAVRGTVFRIGYDGPDTPSLTEVVEGSVAVNLEATGATASLPGGFGAAAKPSGGLAREALLPPPVFVDSGQLQRDNTVAFALRPSAGAVGYHLQIARDRDFVEMVAEGRAATPRIDVGVLPDGAYFVRAMAIAPSGLEGMPQFAAFERKLKALQIQRGRVEGSIVLVWDLGAGQGQAFRFQLFDAANLDQPIIDEPGLTLGEMTVGGLPKGQYSWRVGVLNTAASGPEQQWTPFESFSIDD